MILLVDIGNTSLKWSPWIDEGTVSEASASACYKADDLIEVLDRCWSSLPRPQRVVIASVAGSERDQCLGQWVRTHWDLEPEFSVARAQACGVTNAYLEPHRLGVDRWCTLLAVHKRIQGAACVVDCGTAITVDVLAENGEHLGGLILPGLGMMRVAIEDNTQVRLDADSEGEVALFARDTHSAVSGGTLYATVAFIDRVVDDVAAALQTEPEQVLTGGDAPRVLPLLASEGHHVPDLVLEGLALIAGGCE